MMRSEIRPEGAIYKLHEVVGQGLSSTVYRASRLDSRGLAPQAVALKILKNETAISWLRREFETLAKVRSAHCVRLITWENLPEGPSIVLEWIEGVTLLELTRSRELDHQTIQEIITQLHHGLEDLRSAELHHGDLSPANILIDVQGTAKLIDFATAPIEPGVIQGTPAYLAPEIWLGSPASIESDYFALGLIEHDLLTGWFGLNGAQGVRSDVEAYRERSKALASSAKDFLGRDPEARTKRPRQESSLEQRQRLGKFVRELLEAKKSLYVETAIITRAPCVQDQPRRPSHASFWQTVLPAFVLSGLLSVPVRADAPLLPVENHFAEIIIRSQNWLEISINGRKLGYAPLNLKGLRPGSHRLSWKTMKNSGDSRLQLRAGQRLLISEENLVTSAVLGNH